MDSSQNSSQPADDAVPPVTASVASHPSYPSQIVMQPRPSFGRRLVIWLGWTGFFLCAVVLISQWSARSDYYDVTGGIRERYHSGAEQATDKVAIIAIRGVIMSGEGFVKQQIDRVREDDQVKAVVVRVDSPGGTVTGADYIYHHLKRLQQERQIPVVVSMGSVATSGGYYVSMAVGDQQKSIFAEPTTTTGSIGVIMPHYDISGLLNQLHVEDNSLVSHPRKRLLSMTKPMSEEDREIIQNYIDESFDRFKQIVKAGRPELRGEQDSEKLVDPDTGQNLATGQIFTASQAKEYGLIDEIGFLEEALERATEIAGLPKDQVRFVQYHRPPSLMGMVGMSQVNSGEFSLATLLELSAPRAYYLSTTLPILLRASDQSSQ